MPLRVGRGCSPGCRPTDGYSRSTLVPGPPTRQGHEPDSLGIEHDAGRFAATQLADAGVPVPSGWRRLGDHPRRGLVLELPDGTEPAVVLDWLLLGRRDRRPHATGLPPADELVRWAR